MKNPDLEKAKEALATHTIALCKGDDIVTSGERGIKPMVGFIDEGRKLDGYSVADRTVGKAAALLFVYAGIKSVYAHVLSESGKKVLEVHGIPYEYATLTERVVNRTGDGICPMELATANIDDPTEALAAIKKQLKELQSNNK